MISIASLQKRLDNIEASRNEMRKIHLSIYEDRMIVHANDGDKTYIPSHTGELFHSDNRFVRCVLGPYGSGKSTMAIFEIVRRASTGPIWYSGRRRSRWALVRNTSGELSSTTLQTWLAWFEDLGDMTSRQKPIMTYEHTFNVMNYITNEFSTVELELYFIALDRPQDVRKIKSFELTGAYINEMCEVPKAALAHMKGRVNRYPSKAFCNEPYWSGIIADTNPPADDHWVHNDFELVNDPNQILFKQPPGLIKVDGVWARNPDADNASHLPDNYYLMLAQNQTSDFIKVFCLGEYGVVEIGKRVYPEFNQDIHAADTVEAIQGVTIDLGWDFGLTPACVVTQLTPRGQLLVLKEYIGDGIGIRSFAESIVLPGIVRDFPYCKVGRSIADPAGMARNEIMEEMSCIGELNAIGIPTTPARTNDIDPRLGSVRYFLTRLVDGRPAFMLDKRNCPTLYKGFVKDYVYDRVAVVGEERYKDKPRKNMASHPMDALGYDCLELASDQVTKEKTEKTPVVDMWNPVGRMLMG